MSLCHCFTGSLHEISLPPHHHVTTLVSHLTCPLPPYQSVIWLAHCHHISQSFDLPLTTIVTTSLHHCMIFPYYYITVLLHHCISQSFDLSPATTQVIWLAHYHHISQSFDLPSTTPSPHYRIPHHCMRFPYHHITTSLCEISLPLHHCINASQCNATQHSSDWLTVPTTAIQIISI